MNDRSELGGTADQAVIQLAGTLWQLPAILFTSWWNEMAAAWLPQPAHAAHHASTSNQLVVPEPLEETGEHALFA